MIDDIPVANLLLPIFRKIAPLCSDGAYLNSVNERFRYLKYFPEGKFAVHMDGQFPRGDEISIFTIHFYLNTVKKGKIYLYKKININKYNKYINQEEEPHFLKMTGIK